MEAYEIKRKIKSNIKNKSKGLFIILKKVYQKWKSVENIPIIINNTPITVSI